MINISIPFTDLPQHGRVYNRVATTDNDWQETNVIHPKIIQNKYAP